MVVIAATTSAEVRLPALFADNMVLQQLATPTLWGWTRPSTAITVTSSWDGKSYKTTSDSTGRWKVHLTTPAGSTQRHEITINDGKLHTIRNVAIGEVWICAGQSNMDIPLHGVERIVKIKNSNDHIIAATNPNLRLFSIAHQKAKSPQEECKGSWAESTPQSAADFSAVGYLFGAQLQRQLGIPVGMIKCAYSGTAIEAWISSETASAFGITPTTDCGMDEMRPSDLYNGMVSPVAGYGARGFLWYQGEGNAANPSGYRKLLPAMVKEWRNAWANSEMAFYYVQIAPYRNGGVLNTAPMRQAMADCMADIPHSGMVTLTDAGEQNDIHPADKEVVAKRLLYWALAKNYGYARIAYCGPICKSATVNGAEITVTFDHVTSGLTSYDRPLTTFEICGADSLFIPATARIDKAAATVIVSSEKVPNPIGVRYAYSSWTVGELFNFDALPASSFEIFAK